ncbi:aminoacyl-tRNA hydrolase [Litorimonas sp. RW-G-Af-16]|uniref:aminoacyl-tRNA hydrolase n=1 Tax=Litorimonas sp. RW-G-Af-16 TaxID=3241168 RepID=UPI00390C6A32
MQIWVGLGNPGAKYARHRHNIGFMAIDAIGDDHNFPPEKSQFKGLARVGVINGQKILLLKPSTFMNESGQSVQAAMSFYKVPLENITVFHDELDIDPGKFRIKIGGGIAGHNGLRSIKQHCGNEFRRVRMGIGHPGHKDRVSGYVLSDFAKSEHELRDDMINGSARYADLLAEGKADLFQTRVSEYINDRQ